MHDLPNAEAYAYLLGVYLGDGWVGPVLTTARITISLDGGYPAIIDEVAATCVAVSPGARVRVYAQRGTECVSVYSYGLQWLDLFPQYGPGRKHNRAIVLADWQQEIVDRHPWPFLRGLIHSDGCRTINRFKTRLPSGRVAEYAYPRYFFSNLSEDILAIFCATCDQLDLRWTRSNHRNISVAHRHSTRRMDEFIGPKA